MKLISSYDALRVIYTFIFFSYVELAEALRNWPILAPVAGESIIADVPYLIRWTNDTSGPVSLTLDYDDEPVVISSSTPNNGSFTWAPGIVFAADYDYYLSVCDLNLDSSECSVTSDGRFHIRSSSSSTSSSISSTTSLSSTSSATTKESTTSSLPSNTASGDPGQPSSPSTGSVVGISVGTTLGVLVLAALGWLFYKRIQNKTLSPAEKSATPLQYYSHGEGNMQQRLPYELNGNSQHRTAQ